MYDYRVDHASASLERESQLPSSRPTTFANSLENSSKTLTHLTFKSTSDCWMLESIHTSTYYTTVTTRRVDMHIWIRFICQGQWTDSLTETVNKSYVDDAQSDPIHQSHNLVFVSSTPAIFEPLLSLVPCLGEISNHDICLLFF